jgi:inward rectifier potassium channel
MRNPVKTFRRTAAVHNNENEDLGLGSRITQQSRTRFLNKDGSFNVERTGVPFLRSLSPYHALLTMSWSKFYIIVALAYFLTNAIFACGYVLCGDGALRGATATGALGHFAEAFFFSVQTLATIGYGGISPAGLAANFLVTIEALAGLFGFALATGLLFARFSRPNAKIMFSDKAVIAPFRDISGFMFRIINERKNQLIEVEIKLTFSRMETVNGKPVRRFHQLELERPKVIFFPLHWTIVHPIDEKSPLFGVTQESLEESDAEFSILVTAIDEIFAQTVHTRSSYKYHEITVGAKFRDMFLPSKEGTVRIDVARLHDIEPAKI